MDAAPSGKTNTEHTQQPCSAPSCRQTPRPLLSFLLGNRQAPHGRKVTARSRTGTPCTGQALSDLHSLDRPLNRPALHRGAGRLDSWEPAPEGQGLCPADQAEPRPGAEGLWGRGRASGRGEGKGGAKRGPEFTGQPGGRGAASTGCWEPPPAHCTMTQVVCSRRRACRGRGPASHADAPSRTPRVLPGLVSSPHQAHACPWCHGPDEGRTNTHDNQRDLN